MLNETNKATWLKDYRPPLYWIDTTHLDVELGEAGTLVTSRLQLRANHDHANHPQPLELDGRELELISVHVDGRRLESDEYSVNPEGMVLPQAPERFTLEIRTRIHPESNTSLEGLYRSSGNFCTQCEAQGFRKITYYLDRPDVMARFTTRIVAERARYPVLLSNGNPVQEEDLGDGRHAVTWEDPHPKPSYLFALVAGPLVRIEDSYTTASGRDVALRIFVEERNQDQCEHAMQSLKRSMAWDEKVFGLEYDLDIYMIVAVDDFNMGAMENKGLNVFNSKYVLARPDTATDTDYEQIEGVIAHEYFHNWTGNRVTCRDWFQLSLKEGLTVFRDQEFTADHTSRPVKRIADVRRLRAAQFPEDAGPMAHPIRPESYIEMNNFYTTTVYEKGAEVIRMIHTLLGPEGFRKGMDLYFQRHDGQAVTTDDFLAAMADANDVDLEQFRLWYAQAGTPVLNVQASFDSATRQYHLDVTQSCPPTPGQDHKLPMHMPLRLGLLNDKGVEIPLRLQGEAGPLGKDRTLSVRQAQERFTFEDIDAPPVPSLLRGFSAPVKLEFDYRDADLAFLMAHDSDSFNRWEAAQQLATRVMLRLIRQGRDATALGEELPRAFAALLQDTSQEPALIAQALGLPTEAYVGEQMAVIDVEGIHHARRFLLETLGSRLKDALQQGYRNHSVAGPYRYHPSDAGKRALRNTCLAYLAESGDPAQLDLALGQFRNADNMTDQIAALGVLVNHPGEQRDEALAAFYEQWKNDPLVTDKWLALQASSRMTGTLAHVRELMRHPAFNFKNPNRVRALIGMFAHTNPIHFHAADGSGYAFVAEQIVALDALNPQVAARMTGSLIRWRRYDTDRQALMKAGLEKILARPGVSKDTFEIASKGLA